MRRPMRLSVLFAIFAMPGLAAAQASDLFISEYIEGSSFNKAVELHNATGAAINLATGQYVVQVYSNGSTTPTTITLTGTVADGDVFVLAHTSANGTLLAAADQTSGSLSHNGDDAIVLRKGGAAGAIVDSFGIVGNDPGSEWGSGAHGTADATLRRKAAVCAGDTNTGDAFDPTVEWDAFAQDTSDGFGTHTSSCGGPPGPTDPSVDAAASPSTVVSGSNTLLTAVVTGGANPASTGLAVSADLGAIGGGSADAFYDDGSHGDATAGDGTFSLEVTVPVATPAGSAAILVTATDAEARDGSDTITLTLSGPPVQTDPTVDAAATPATVSAGGSTLLTAIVAGGTNPASTGLVVTADLGAIGGSAAAPLFDDATNGDVTAGDGTFSRQVTIPAATAAGIVNIAVTATDAETRDGTDSVALSIAAKVTIAQIQGQGIVPALPVGTDVITEGVVTARRANGYFIQSWKTDTDPTTAEGLFVFTNAAAPANAVVGNRVRVAGRVGQFQRSPHAYAVTQLTNSTITAVLATGTTLPPAPSINGYLAPTTPVSALGRYQGMRVRVTTADVVGPTNAFGDFYVIRSFIPRPSREPGIAVLDTVPLPPGHAIPAFDRNPERLRVESTGLEGGTALNVDNGTRITGLEGILYYDRGDFTLLIGDHSSLVLSGGPNISAVPVPGVGSLRIGSFNIENLSGGASVNLARLEKLSDVFCNYLRNPDIVGLVEIGNLATAQRVAEAINDNEFGTCPDSPQYEAHMLATTGTQRLGYLIKTAPAPGGIEPRVEIVSIQEEFVGETLTSPLGTPNGALFDRPPLHLVARVTGENGTSYDVEVLLNHTLSLLEIVDLTPDPLWGTDGHRGRAKRLQQAVRLSQLVDQIQDLNPDQPLVLIGDYNAFNFSDGYVDVMGIISGTPAAVNTVLEHADSAVDRPLTNLIGTKPVAQRYSYVFEGNIQTLDHAVVNQPVLDQTITTLHHARVNSDFAVDNAADPTVPVRTSDHDPLVIDMVVPSFLDADLAATLTARTATRPQGYVANFNGTVANVGPMRALRPEVTVLINADPAQVKLVRAIGWTCSAPIADPVGSRSFCGRNLPQEPGVSDAFLIQVQTVAPGSIQVGIEAATRSVDVQPANNAASAAIVVTP